MQTTAKEYRMPKKEFKKEDIDFMRVFFNNGDYFPIGGKEIEEVSVKLYDRLISENDAICRVAERGFIKMRIANRPKIIYTDAFLYDIKNYRRDRKSYISDRLCNEGGIKCIAIFNENNWHDTLFGNITAETDGEFVFIRFISKSIKEPSDGKDNVILLNDVTKSVIDKIELDFENCEGFTIYPDEILDMQLKMKSQLEWGSGDLNRCIESGYIRLKLDGKISYREVHLFEVDDGKELTVKMMKKRLCWNKKVTIHDICHLYVSYDYAGFGLRRRECLEIDDIKDPEEIEKMIEEEEETMIEQYYFEGGCCEQQAGGSILIAFGKTAKRILEKANIEV